MSQSTKAHLSESDIVEREMRDQQDMTVRAARLARFRAKTDGKVWHRNPFTGEWTLIDNISNTTPARPEPMTLSAYCLSLID